MIKSTIYLILILLIGAFIGCTKDILPDPATVNANQVQIYEQTFNASYPNWPKGWVSSGDSGFVMDTSVANNSSGVSTGEGTYSGASGGAMVDISNPVVTSGGTYTLTTDTISTAGYTNITCIWGARNSKHFSDNGSSISFAWSSDGGATWTPVNYTEAAKNSDWELVDGGVNIPISGVPAEATLKFRWTGTVFKTSSGTYRIDDFQIFGTHN